VVENLHNNPRQWSTKKLNRFSQIWEVKRANFFGRHIFGNALSSRMKQATDSFVNFFFVPPLLTLSSGLNFTNLCAPSKKSTVHSVQIKIRSSISPTKCKPNLCAEICQTLFAICQICAPKKSFSSCARKKGSQICWCNWPQVEFVVLHCWKPPISRQCCN